MKRFHEHIETINESLMIMLIYGALIASMAQEAKYNRTKYKLEQKRMDGELKRLEDGEQSEKIQSKIEKERRKKELSDEKFRREQEKVNHMMAKFQLYQEKLADSKEKKLECQRLALAAHKMANDRETEEDKKLIEKNAKNKEKYSEKQIEDAKKKADKEISDDEAKKYSEKLAKISEKISKQEPEEPKREIVINPETGKKEKHIIHKGPRGGKYWTSDKGNRVYVNEDQEEASRQDITNSRLAYLQWVIDNTKDKKTSNSLQEIYNALYNITYDTGGDLRSLDDIISYITQTMQNNKGLIPGLPTNDQIEEIDKKTKSFQELYPEEFKSYIKRIENSNLDKSKKDKEDQSDSILSPSETEDNKDARKKISELTSIFGFTNIIGLESNRKPSAEDIKKKSKLKKDQKDNAMLQSREEDETVLKKPEEVDAEEVDAEEVDAEEVDAEEVDAEEDDEDNVDEDMILYVVMMAEEYLDQFKEDEYNEADVDKWLDEQDLESELGIEDDESKKGFRDAMKQEIQNELESDEEEEKTSESLLGFSQNFIFELFGKKEDKFSSLKYSAEMFDKYGDGEFKPELTAKEIQKAMKKNKKAVSFNKVANLLTGPLGAAIINKKQDNMKKCLAGMKYMIDNTRDEEKKVELQKNYDAMMKSCVTKNGRFRARPKLKNLSTEEREGFMSAYKDIKSSKSIKQAGKEYLEKHEDFADQVVQDKLLSKKEKKMTKKGDLKKTQMGDGSTLIARKSERDGHMIYTREKGGKTVEYMDKDEYQKQLADKKESVEHHFKSFKMLLESKR